MHRPIGAALLIAIGLGCTPSTKLTATPSQIRLGFESSPSTEATVTWRNNAAKGTVEYGTDVLTERVAAYSRQYEGGYLHHAKLTGLKPQTRYRYRCGDGTAWSETHAFSTAPEPGSRAPLHIVAMGDSRTDDDARASVARAALARRPELVLHTGDLVENGHRQQQWDQWFGTMQPLLSGAPLLVAIGNHEGGSPLYFEQLVLPAHGTATSEHRPEAFYSVDYGMVHFVSLSTEPVGEPNGEQTRWLKSDLAKARANASVPWIIVMGHRPPYSCGRHGDHLPAQSAWASLFETYAVDLTLWGHDHNYQRTKPLLQGRPAPGGVTHIVTGGAGAPIYEASDDPRMAATREVHHFLDIRITENQLSVEAHDTSGTVFDRWSTKPRLR